MSCRSLLLLILTSSVCEMSDDHNEALDYQAEENSDVTIEWQFASKVRISIPSLKIHCLQLPQLKVFFNMDKRFVEPQHEQFAGRVQCDEDALMTGRVRLHLSAVGTSDSGRYLCRMATQFGRKVKEFRLKVTAAAATPKPVTPVSKPKPERQERMSLFAYLALSAGLAACLAAFIILIIHCVTQCRQSTCHETAGTVTIWLTSVSKSVSFHWMWAIVLLGEKTSIRIKRITWISSSDPSL